MSKLLGSISLNTYVRTKDFCVIKGKILVSGEKHRTKKIYLISSRNAKGFRHQTRLVFFTPLQTEVNYLLIIY